MIDITLLLLFFFMLSNVTDPTGSRRPIRLPTASTEARSDTEPPASTTATRLILDIDEKGGIHAGEQQVAPTQLRPFLEHKRELLIRADAATPAKTIQRIVRTAAQAGIERIQHSIQSP